MRNYVNYGIFACLIASLVACGDEKAVEPVTGENGDTTKISYALKPFKGPLANSHKGFTLLTEGAWNLISYGSGYQRWDKLKHCWRCLRMVMAKFILTP